MMRSLLGHHPNLRLIPLTPLMSSSHMTLPETPTRGCSMDANSTRNAFDPTLSSNLSDTPRWHAPSLLGLDPSHIYPMATIESEQRLAHVIHTVHEQKIKPIDDIESCRRLISMTDTPSSRYGKKNRVKIISPDGACSHPVTNKTIPNESTSSIPLSNRFDLLQQTVTQDEDVTDEPLQDHHVSCSSNSSSKKQKNTKSLKNEKKNIYTKKSIKTCSLVEAHQPLITSYYKRGGESGVSLGSSVWQRGSTARIKRRLRNNHLHSRSQTGPASDIFSDDSEFVTYTHHQAPTSIKFNFSLQADKFVTLPDEIRTFDEGGDSTPAAVAHSDRAGSWDGRPPIKQITYSRRNNFRNTKLNTIRINNPKNISYKFFYNNVAFRGRYNYIHFQRSLHYNELPSAVHSVLNIHRILSLK